LIVLMQSIEAVRPLGGSMRYSNDVVYPGELRRPVDVRYSRKAAGWVLYVDGKADGGYGGVAVYDSRAEALGEYFEAEGIGGYPFVYVGDGELVCHNCARAAWLAAPGDYDLDKVTLTEPQSDGESCAWCYAEISGAFCRSCGRDDPGLLDRAFRDDSGRGLMCRECMCLARQCTRPGAENRAYYETAEWVGPGMYQTREHGPRGVQSGGLFYDPRRSYTAEDWKRARKVARSGA
jgi:hypothetical protein